MANAQQKRQELIEAAVAAHRKRLEAYLTDDITTLDQIESVVEEIAQDQSRWWKGRLIEHFPPEPSDTSV